MKAKLIVPGEVTTYLGGIEIADLFWDLDEDEQAKFFNCIGAKPKLMFQLQFVTDSKELSVVGRNAMAFIGDYSGD